MGRRTNAQIEADNLELERNRDAAILLETAKVYDRYGVPASANVARVVAQSILDGTREVPGG